MEIQRMGVLLDRYATVNTIKTVPSTNARLAEMAAQGAEDRTVLIAGEQTAGRGRRSRDWASPQGSGLYLSVLLRPDGVPPARLGWLTALAGVALVRTARWAGAQAALKWPNDLLLGPEQRKGAGVLAEASGGAVVLGMGLNVQPLPDDVPLGPGGLAPTSLAQAGATVLDLDEVAITLLGELSTLERTWRDAHGDPDAGGFRDEYVAACATIGRHVKVELATGTMVGAVATGIGEDGGLLLRDPDGTESAVTAGDVVHVRPMP